MSNVIAKPRWEQLGDGFHRDNMIITLLDGTRWYREWTPTLLNGERVNLAQAKEFAKTFTEKGGNWIVPKVHDQISRVNYSKFNPAVDDELKADTYADWYVTDQEDPSGSSSVYVVSFYGGYVSWHPRDLSARLRLCRLSASQ